MITGEGTPLIDILTRAQAVGSDARKVDSKSNNINDLLSTTSSSRLIDLVDLSETARAQLDLDQKSAQDIETIKTKLSEQKTALINQRLDQVDKQIEILQNLLSQAGPEQAQIIAKGIDDIGQSLKSITLQLSTSSLQNIDVQDVEELDSNIDIDAIRLTSSFNQFSSSTETQGNTEGFKQSLEVELSFIPHTFVETSLENDSNNKANTNSLKEVENTLILAQQELNAKISSEKLNQVVINSFKLKVEQESYSLDNNIMYKYNQTLKSFTDVIEEFSQNLTDEKRTPPSMLRMIKNLLHANPAPSNDSELVNTTV